MAAVALTTVAVLAAPTPQTWAKFESQWIQRHLPNVEASDLETIRWLAQAQRGAWKRWQHVKPEPVLPSSLESETTDSSIAAETRTGESSYGPWAIPAYIVMCESGGQNIESVSASSASGYYMIIDGTWNGFGGYARAILAPKAVQDAKAAELWAGGAGASHWAACL